MTQLPLVSYTSAPIVNPRWTRRVALGLLLFAVATLLSLMIGVLIRVPILMSLTTRRFNIASWISFYMLVQPVFSLSNQLCVVSGAWLISSTIEAKDKNQSVGILWALRGAALIHAFISVSQTVIGMMSSYRGSTSMGTTLWTFMSMIVYTGLGLLMIVVMRRNLRVVGLRTMAMEYTIATSTQLLVYIVSMLIHLAFSTMRTAAPATMPSMPMQIFSFSVGTINMAILMWLLIFFVRAWLATKSRTNWQATGG